jgi:hypothetical protein
LQSAMNRTWKCHIMWNKIWFNQNSLLFSLQYHSFHVLMQKTVRKIILNCHLPSLQADDEDDVFKVQNELAVWWHSLH